MVSYYKEGYAYRKAGIGRFKLKQISCFFISLKNELLFFLLYFISIKYN